MKRFFVRFAVSAPRALTSRALTSRALTSRALTPCALILCVLLAAATPAAAAAAPAASSAATATAAATAAAAAAAAAVAATTTGTAPPGPHVDLSLTVDPPARRLTATAAVRLPPGFAGAFYLAATHELTEAVALPGNRPAPQSLENGWRRIGVPPGSTGLKLAYRGALPAMDAQNAAIGAGAAGAFLPAGGGWAPDDFGPTPPTWRLTLETNAGFIGVASGRLEGEEISPDRYRGRFSEDRPVESPSVFIGRWTVAEQMRGGLRYRAYLDPDQAALAPGLIDAAAQAAERYAGQIGPYPFAGFSIVAAPLPVGLGYPGLTYISRQILPLPFVRDRSMAHEVLHNWWGVGVRVRVEQGNWAEGLTTYMADHAVAEIERPAAAAAVRLDWLRDFTALAPDREISLRACRNRRHDAQQVVCYGKAAMVFHMLRREIGDAAFADGVRELWRRRQFRAAGWDDLRAAFETASKRELGGFFAQWLDQPGAPSLRLADVQVDGRKVTAAVAQNAPPWRLRVPLRIETEAGPETSVLETAETVASTTVVAAARPLRATVDPDYDVFRRLEPGETSLILRDFTLRRRIATLLLGGAAEKAAGAAVVDALFGDGAAPVDVAGAVAGDGPLVVLGPFKDAADVAARLGVKSPLSASARATGRVWTARTRNGRPLLVIEAVDAAGLEALARPLPHYRRESWVTFNVRTVLGHGVWPAGDGGLSRTLDGTTK